VQTPSAQAEAAKTAAPGRAVAVAERAGTDQESAAHDHRRSRAPARHGRAAPPGRPYAAPPPPSATFGRSGPAPGENAAELARQIRVAIDALAPVFGLDPDRVRLTVIASDRPDAPASGAADAETITITGALDPGSGRDRQLLAHELVHVRQHRNRVAATPDVTAAEAEAAGLANAISEGRPLWVPRRALPDGHVAHDGGATGLAADTTAPGNQTPATVATATTPDVAALELKLDQLVAANHAGDAQLIKGQLDHPWTQTTEDMIENCLRVLSTLRFVVARALVRSLDPAVRMRLGLLRDSHHDMYPEQCVAVLSALSEQELTGLAQQQVRGETYPGATAALHGVDPGRLSDIARRALLAALRRLPADALTTLVQGDRREVFLGLLQSGPDAGTDEADLRAAIGGEEGLAAQQVSGGNDISLDAVRKGLRDANADSAREALNALKPLCEKVPAGAGKAAEQTAPENLPPVTKPPTAAAAGGAPPSAPKPGSNAPPPVSDELIATVARLDADGLIDKLLDKLPSDDRYSPEFRPTLSVVLAARAPLPNLARAIDLLSYSLFDWAVTDDDARFANLLVRSTPVEAQDKWRELENGKWLHRLEDNVPDFMFTSGEYTGIGSEYVGAPGDIPGLSAADLQKQADDQIRDWDRSSSSGNAMIIVRKLLGLDANGLLSPWDKDATGKPAPFEIAHRTAVIRRMDARLKLDTIIAHLPDDYLFGEQGRIELLDFNQLRDPVHLKQQVRDIVPSGFFGWLTFTHRDAWLAAQAFRALSPADQQKFSADNPGLWTTIWTALTDDMRRALPTTLATGRDERLPSRQSIRDRLDDQRLWTADSKEVLRALIDLAYAADDRAWVFETSRKYRADKVKELAEIVSTFQLYSEADGRLAFKPGRTPSSRVPMGLYALGVIGRAIGILAYDLLADDTVSLDLMGKTMHLKGFDLGDVQTIAGGDLFGATLARDQGANKIDVDATFEAGFIVNVDLKDLEIAGVNFVLPGKSYKCGPVSVRGLKASAGFSDRGYHDPAYIALSLDSLSLADLVLIDPSLPLSGAWAIASLALQRLAFRATTDGAEDPIGKIGKELPKGTIPVPVFGPLFQMLKNIVAIKGGIPGDETLLDLALIPFHLPFGVSSLADLAAPTPAPATYLWGLASDGVLRPPYSAAQRIKDATGMLRAFNVSFDSLDVQGITLGSGQQIKSLAIADLSLSIGQSLPAYLNAALAMLLSAQAKLPKDSQQYKDLDARIATLRAQAAAVEATPRITELRAKRDHDAGSLTDQERKELATADTSVQDEGRLRELEAKDRWHPGSLTDAERAQLVELTKRLRSDVGFAAEIGSITLGPLTGTVEAAGVTLTGIHTSARLPNTGPVLYAPGYLDDKSLIEQFKKGGPKVPTIGELARSSEFNLTVDSTQILRTDPAQPAVVIKADRLPKVTELAARIAALPDIEGNEPIRDRLNQALFILMSLDRAKGKELVAASEQDKQAAAQLVRELTDEARRLLGIEIGGLQFGRITGALDPDTGTLTATVNDTVITKLAGPDFAVDELTGSLELRLGAGGVKERLDQLKGIDPGKLAGQLTPGLGLKDVTAKGIHLAQGSIAQATIGHLTGNLKATETGFEIPDLTVDRLEIDGIALGTEGSGITGEAVIIQGLALDVALDITKTSTGTQLTRALIKSLSIGSLGGKRVVADLPDIAGGVHAELIGGELHHIEASNLDFEDGSEGWYLAGGSGSVGSFADVKYSAAIGALKSRKTVKGTLSTSAEAVQKGAPTITASYARSPDGTKFSLSLSTAQLQALGTVITTPDGSVTIRKVTVAGKYEASEAGAKASATLDGLTIGAIDWKAGSARLHGPGPVTAKQVTLAAFATPDVPAKDGKPAKKGAWSVTDIVIASIEGSGLRYTDPPLDIHLGRDDKPANPGEAPLRIGRVHINPAKGQLSVTDLSADFGGDVTKSLQASGHLSIDSMSLDLHRGDHLVAVVHGVSADVKLSGDLSGTIALRGLPGAKIDVGPDGITVGSDDENDDGLRIEQITLSSLKLTSAVAGHNFTLTTQQDGRVDLLGIRVQIRIDKWKLDEKHASKSPWKQIAVQKLSIERVNLGAIQVDLPGDDVTIVIPAGAEADPPTLHNLELGGGVGSDGLWHPEFLFNLETFALEGGASVTDITLPLSARIKDKFKGDVVLTTMKSSIGLLAGGGLTVDVQNAALTIARAAQLGKDKTIRIGKFGAEKLTFADGRLFVKGPTITDLEYTQKVGDSLAVWIKVLSANLGELDYTTAFGGGLDIRSLDIKEAFISLDLAALTATAPGTTGTSSGFDKTKLRPAVDQVDGSVSVVMFVSANVKGLKDFRIGSDDDMLVVPIKQGSVDIPTFEKNIKGKVHAEQIGSGFYLRPWVVNAVAKDPMLRLDHEQLQLGVYKLDPDFAAKGNDPQGINRPDNWAWTKILAWDLRAPDISKAGADKFALWAAIFDLHKEPELTEAQKAAETQSEKEEREKDDAAIRATLDSLEIRKLVADLDIMNTGPLPIPIKSDTVNGVVTLSDQALLKLHVSGGIPAVKPPDARPGSNPGGLEMSLGALKLDSIDLSIFDKPVPTEIHGLHTGAIQVKDLTDATITFDDLWHPQRFVGTIRSAHADSVRWYKN
jgi:Domain of unknown function (DUF4157)